MKCLVRRAKYDIFNLLTREGEGAAEKTRPAHRDRGELQADRLRAHRAGQGPGPGEVLEERQDREVHGEPALAPGDGHVVGGGLLAEDALEEQPEDVRLLDPVRRCGRVLR